MPERFFKLKMKNLLIIALLLSAFCIGSCKKDPNKKEEESAEKIAPDNFDYSTTKKVTVNVRLLTNESQPLSGVKIVISSLGGAAGTSLFTGLTDNSGYAKGEMTIPSYLDTVVISPNYIGLLNNAKALIKNNSITAVIGGPEGFTGDIIASDVNSGLSTLSAIKTSNKISSVYEGVEYIYPNNQSEENSVFQPSGRPKYSEITRDVISSSLLSFINSSLPEGESVPVNHPEYLSASALSTLDIKKQSDVYLTFVYENADYLNTIAWYTYPTSNPPKVVKDISRVTMVFPNASIKGAGGELVSGEKVKIGNFDPGTSIGFVLVQNGWEKKNNSYFGVQPKNPKFYANANLNPESSAKKHTVMLYDDVHNVFVIGLEDLNRENPSANDYGYKSDHDFNDMVIYATTNVTDALSKQGVSVIDKGDDTDGDGVKNSTDEFPSDAKRAYTSTTGWSTLAFEDQWPKTADYDLNDLVVNYRYKFTSNAQNQIVDITGDYTVVAAGAAYENGFGVQFPFSSNIISKVTGQRHVKSYIQKASNGSEAGQSKAVIIPFDNYKALIDNPGSAYFVNTKRTMDKVQGDTAHVYIEFTSPQSPSTVGNAPFNPFMICNMNRGYEVHLPGNAPTDKADRKLFKTEEDTSNPGSNRYYQTKDNWPWAINIAEPFAYPSEDSPINKAYLHFLEWASSGGSLYKDWYKNTTGGYRDNSMVY
jgi:LruC domain-containing protein